MNLDTPIEAIRFILFDTEATGLNPEKDRLISIGAVALQGGDILSEDTFEALVPVDYNTSTVIIHGISREQSLMGIPEGEALEQFAEYCSDSVLVGFHIKNDLEMIHAALRRQGLPLFPQYSLETLFLIYFLEDNAAFSAKGKPGGYTLDAVADYFGIVTHDRHTASGDAFITAQIFLRLLRYAQKLNIHTLGQLLAAKPAE